MTLYLVQHAEAVTEAVDPRKGLSPKGERVSLALAAACVRKGLDARAIIHSGKLRARQTAEILAEALHLPVRESAGLDPLDPVRPFEDGIKGLQDGTIIVGHNPFMERLTSSLLAGREDPPVLSFQRGGMACLAETGGAWRLLWTAFPDQPCPAGS